MKKAVSAVCFLTACGLLLSGCGSLKVDTNTISVEKNGKVLEGIVESFSQDYYNETELESYINDSVSQYVADHDKNSVKVSDYKSEDGKAYVNLTYADANTFADFNQVTFFNGSIVDAQAADYKFDETFLSVADGVIGASADSSEVLANDDLKVVIVKEWMDVIVPGNICYVSGKDVKVTGKKSVSITPTAETTDVKGTITTEEDGSAVSEDTATNDSSAASEDTTANDSSAASEATTANDSSAAAQEQTAIPPLVYILYK